MVAVWQSLPSLEAKRGKKQLEYSIKLQLTWYHWDSTTWTDGWLNGVFNYSKLLPLASPTRTHLWVFSSVIARHFISFFTTCVLFYHDSTFYLILYIHVYNDSSVATYVTSHTCTCTRGDKYVIYNVTYMYMYTCMHAIQITLTVFASMIILVTLLRLWTRMLWTNFCFKRRAYFAVLPWWWSKSVNAATGTHIGRLAIAILDRV